jgi:GTP-binding protein
MVPMPTGKVGNYVRHTFRSLDFVPIAFITATAGKNVQAVLNLASNLHKQASRRVTTGDLNRVLQQALDDSPPPLRQNRRPKVYYGTQVATNPPTLVLFTNGPELFDNTYQRYLQKTFHDKLGFSDVPVKLYLRRKQRDDEPPSDEVPMPPQSKSRKRLPKPEKDVSGLKFTTSLDDEDTGNDSPYESELWKDL